MPEGKKKKLAPPKPRVALFIDWDNLGGVVAHLHPRTGRVGKALRRLGDLVFACAYRGGEPPGPVDRTEPLGIRLVNVKPGRNAADRALIADAVALSASEGADEFVIASCDTDFCALVKTLQKDGKRVTVVGKEAGRLGKYADAFISISEKAKNEEATVRRRRKKWGNVKPKYLLKRGSGRMVEQAEAVFRPDPAMVESARRMRIWMKELELRAARVPG